MRAQGDPGQKLGRHEVVQQTALSVGWPGHTEDVLAKPFQQPGDVVVHAIAGSHAARARRSRWAELERGLPRRCGRACACCRCAQASIVLEARCSRGLTAASRPWNRRQCNGSSPLFGSCANRLAPEKGSWPQPGVTLSYTAAAWRDIVVYYGCRDRAWFKTPAIRVTVLALSTGVGSCSGFCLPRSGGISLPGGASPRVGAVGSGPPILLTRTPNGGDSSTRAGPGVDCDQAPLGTP